MEGINSSKNETNLLRSENFEELLEDIEAEAEICSPTKSISRSDIKQKKKSKIDLYFLLSHQICIIIKYLF